MKKAGVDKESVYTLHLLNGCDKQQEMLPIFLRYKIACVKEHQLYAHRIGLHDTVVQNFGEVEAMETLSKDQYFHFVICDTESKNPVGMVEVSLETSAIDQELYLYMHCLYIDENYRKKGIASSVIRDFAKDCDLRIEFECWYSLPAIHFYNKMGCKEVHRRYLYRHNK